MLTVLCITRAMSHAWPFLIDMEALAACCGDAELVIGADGVDATDSVVRNIGAARVVTVHAPGYPEAVLEQVLAECRGDHILRLDDDERCSNDMAAWLIARSYTTSDHWCFPRAWLWGDERHRLVNAPFWPDHQTRLSVRAKAGGIRSIHPQSPFGMGRVAPVAIEHHKFLLQSRELREALVLAYDRIQPGAGMREFYIPEERPMTVDTWRTCASH
jgi:hypothetical protein